MTAVAERMAATAELLSAPPFSDRDDAVCRYAFTPGFAATVDHVGSLLADAGLRVRRDRAGSLWGDRGSPGAPRVGVGSHLDSVRRGGRWDGVLGMLVALEVARAAPDLPVRAVAWVEEEGAGFGQLLLGSRIATGAVDADALATTIRALDDGRPFTEHARAAGMPTAACTESAAILDGMAAWIEPHIEQARVLEDTGTRLGVVDRIAGFVQGELVVEGRADHAGATPMALRRDAGLLAAEVMLRLEELALAHGAVATVGDVALTPGAMNVVPARARLTLDIRGPHDAAVLDTLEEVLAFAGERAVARGLRTDYRERSRQPATVLDTGVVDALADAARVEGIEPLRMVSGAAHDTMVLAPYVPSAMLFVPCVDGLSHDPGEAVDPADAALAVRVVTRAAHTLIGGRDG